MRFRLPGQPGWRASQHQDLLVSSPGPSINLPFIPPDWTKFFARPIPRAVSIDPILLSTTLATTYILRSPTASPRVQVAPRVAWDSPNLALTLLPTTDHPFFNREWPFAQPPRPTRADQTQNLLNTLLPTTLAPLNNDSDDWGERSQYVPSRSIEAAQNLLGLYLPLGKPFVTPNWPAVPYSAPRVAEAVQNLLETTLALAPVPFVAGDWTVPRLNAQRTADATQNLLNTLLPTTLAPFKPVDRTVPQQPARRTTDTAQNGVLATLGLLPQPVPFNDNNWLVPSKPERRRVEATSDALPTLYPLIPPAQQYVFRTPTAVSNGYWPKPRINDNQTNTLQTVYVPFCSFDWTVPPLSWPTRNRDIDENLQMSTLGPGFVYPMPFPSVNWEVAPRNRRSNQSPSDNNPLMSELLPVGTLPSPFVNYDWTVSPQSRVTANRAAELDLLNSTLAPTGTFASPFASADWTARIRTHPMPQVFVDENLTLGTLAPAGTFLAQFTSFDWSVSPRSMRATPWEPLVNLQLSTLAPVGTIPKPFLSPDWTVAPRNRARWNVHVENGTLDDRPIVFTLMHRFTIRCAKTTTNTVIAVKTKQALVRTTKTVTLTIPS